MDNGIREIRQKVLQSMTDIDGHSFALAGGSALEMFYLNHRFSRDLDFFTRRYNGNEIEEIVGLLKKKLGYPVSKDIEIMTPHHARAVFYMLDALGLERPLKIDFIEEVLVSNPRVNMFKGLPVYRVEDIYYHKIFTIAGIRDATNGAGKYIFTGRDEPRDALDIYYLSRKVRPLHEFLEEIPDLQQRMFVAWARTYSRMDMKLGVLDLDIYDKKFDVREMIKHIDDEVEEFMRGIL